MKKKVASIIALCGLGIYLLLTLFFFFSDLVTQPDSKNAAINTGVVLGLMVGILIGTFLPALIENLKKEKKNELQKTQGEQPPQL